MFAPPLPVSPLATRRPAVPGLRPDREEHHAAGRADAPMAAPALPAAPPGEFDEPSGGHHDASIAKPVMVGALRQNVRASQQTLRWFATGSAAIRRRGRLEVPNRGPKWHAWNAVHFIALCFFPRTIILCASYAIYVRSSVPCVPLDAGAFMSDGYRFSFRVPVAFHSRAMRAKVAQVHAPDVGIAPDAGVHPQARAVASRLGPAQGR